ncbi:MAG TPA: inositol monophosphatase [Candidatus Saccharimonadia bacterium]|nr:inositol monophosphatase [Candidatus Saccharimonadia bacterium]
MIDHETYLAFATKLAHQAGDIMLEHFQIGIDRDTKTDNTPVTVADLKINQLVIDTVRQTYPTHSILAEEGSHLEPNATHVWVCDPIDGTFPYTLGVPTSTFSLALVVAGKPEVAVIYDPYTKRLYRATVGKGAFVNDQRLQVSSHISLKNTHVGVAVYKTEQLDIAGLNAELMEQGIWGLSYLCITYEGTLVALGQFSGATFAFTSPWDIAALKLIVEEAGGTVTDLYGREQRYDQPIRGAIISNSHVHDTLVSIVKKHLLP